MRSRFAWTVLSCLTVALLHADDASAQQSVNFSLGYFTIRGEDARVEGDVLVENREVYLFDFSDFGSWSFGGEYVAPLGEFLEGERTLRSDVLDRIAQAAGATITLTTPT